MLKVKVVNGNPVEHIMVIAPSEPVFLSWCFQHNINPHAKTVRRVLSSFDLYGTFQSWYVNLGYPDNLAGDDIQHHFEYVKHAHQLKFAEG